MESVASRKTLILLALVTSAMFAFAGGCVHPCLALAEEICECEETDADREACKRQARRDFDRTRGFETDAAKDLCSELLDRCDCLHLETEQGKRDCGLAR